jgi:N-acylneuraminate cytidylyltransferase
MSFKNVLCIVPARRDSRRFPHKNLAHFRGVPLVQNTVSIAKEAGLEKILVTTDDPNVALIADHEEVACLERPDDLCTDTARMEAVVENAVHYATSATDGPHWEFDTICLMQVTSPLLRHDSLQAALDLYFMEGAESLTAVNILWEPVGAFYIIDSKLFMKNRSVYQEGGHLYMLGANQCIDVDHQYQLAIANIIGAGRTE